MGGTPAAIERSMQRHDVVMVPICGALIDAVSDRCGYDLTPDRLAICLEDYLFSASGIDDEIEAITADPHREEQER